MNKINHQESNAIVVREQSNNAKINPTIILKDYKAIEYSGEITFKDSSYLKKKFIIIPDNTSK